MNSPTTNMVGSSGSALSRAAGAFLTERFLSAAGHRVTLFGASSSRAFAVTLHSYDFVEKMILDLGAEHRVTEIDLADLFVLQVFYLQLWHCTLRHPANPALQRAESPFQR
jgi:hypothetical protein